MSAAVDPSSGFDGGVQLISELIESGVRFTAIIAFDDLTALGAVCALRHSGRSVPADCSVMGFDDVPTAALSSPGITTIHQPMEEMGVPALSSRPVGYGATHTRAWIQTGLYKFDAGHALRVSSVLRI